MLQDWEAVKPNVIASTYMENTPLWSLSYEWWFYMLFFPITMILTNNKHRIIFTTAVLSSVLYTFHPIFPVRIIMYMGIWWTGVFLSDLYLKKSQINFKTLKLPFFALALICATLLSSIYLQKAEGIPMLLGKHPVLEFRHFSFSIVLLATSIVWMRFQWLGFNLIFKPFLILAPISYALYISHVPLMANAHYLNMINNDLLKWLLYLVVVLIFSWTVEIYIYRKVRSLFSSFVAQSSQTKYLSTDK
jgi:peptidoglycan/LPS O-acetylase OafA/YrhL